MIDQTRRIGSASPGHEPQKQRQTDSAQDFARILRQQQTERSARNVQNESAPAPLSFSKHAQARLEKREISLAPEQSLRLQNATRSAAARGARQSMVFLDGIAFIVNVAEKRVVTAVDVSQSSGSAQGGAVFTNIDSAVVA